MKKQKKLCLTLTFLDIQKSNIVVLYTDLENK